MVGISEFKPLKAQFLEPPKSVIHVDQKWYLENQAHPFFISESAFGLLKTGFLVCPLQTTLYQKIISICPNG